MLVLLDIDGTLLTSEGIGARGIIHAGTELFGDSFSLDGIELGQLPGEQVRPIENFLKILVLELQCYECLLCKKKNKNTIINILLLIQNGCLDRQV